MATSFPAAAKPPATALSEIIVIPGQATWTAVSDIAAIVSCLSSLILVCIGAAGVFILFDLEKARAFSGQLAKFLEREGFVMIKNVVGAVQALRGGAILDFKLLITNGAQLIGKINFFKHLSTSGGCESKT